jgi:phage tail sheath protein FI
MAIPGVTVTSGTSAPSTAPPTDTGTWFCAGITEKGSATAPTLIRSLSQYASTYGERVSYGVLYDSLQTFFEEGGTRAYVSRVVGPSPVTASVSGEILDAGGKKVLKMTASSPGEWANTLKPELTLTGENLVIVVKLGTTTVETSPTFKTNAEAISWSANSAYIRLAEGSEAGTIAKTQTVEVKGGTDDHANATEATWLNALTLFTSDLGPGQVSMPGRTTATAQENLLTHAKEKNRLALLDGTDTPTAATLTAQAAVLRGKSTARYGGLFAPWVVIPGLTAGTTRTVAPCSLMAGLMARSDGSGGNPNQAIAGVNNLGRYVTGISQPNWTAAERGTLSEGGVNVLRLINARVEPYDNVTLVNYVVDSTWLQLSNARLNMAICSRSAAVAERHLFAQLDGRGVEISKFNGDLVGEVLLPLLEAGALFEENKQGPESAFQCNTGEAVNTTKTLSEGKLLAVIGVRMSPSAQTVNIEIIKEAL